MPKIADKCPLPQDYLRILHATSVSSCPRCSISQFLDNVVPISINIIIIIITIIINSLYVAINHSFHQPFPPAKTKKLKCLASQSSGIDRMYQVAGRSNIYPGFFFSMRLTQRPQHSLKPQTVESQVSLVGFICLHSTLLLVVTWALGLPRVSHWCSDWKRA